MRFSFLVEKTYPSLGGFVAAIFFWYSKLPFEPMFSLVISGVTLLYAVITAAVFASLPDSPTLRRFKQAGGSKMVLSFAAQADVSSVVVLIGALWFLLVDSLRHDPLWSSVLFGATVWSCLNIYRLTRSVLAIVRVEVGDPS